MVAVVRDVVTVVDAADVTDVVREVAVAVERCEVPDGAPREIRVLVARAGVGCHRVAFALAGPRDVIVTREGNVLVTEMRGGRIVRLNGERFVTVAAGLTTPIGMRELPDGRVLVAEEDAHRIERVNVQTAEREVIANGLAQVTYLALGTDGNAYVSSFTTFAPTGTIWRVPVTVGARYTAYATGLNVPEGLLFDGASLLVAEWNGASRVARFVSAGIHASDALTVTNGYNGIYGILRASDGSLLVADHGRDTSPTGRLVQVHSDGTQETVLDGIVTPGGMTQAPNGDIWLTEFNGTGGAGYLLRITGL
jgi:sugar lactone lactonase YvrE